MARNNHTEDEQFSPLSVYGQSKAAGDLSVSLVPNHYILRTTWVIGEGKNFVRTMLDLGKKNVAPTVVTDQVGRLTFTSELVRVIDHLLTNAPRIMGHTMLLTMAAHQVGLILHVNIFKLAGFNQQVTDTTTAEYFANKTGYCSKTIK